MLVFLGYLLGKGLPCCGSDNHGPEALSGEDSLLTLRRKPDSLPSSLAAAPRGAESMCFRFNTLRAWERAHLGTHEDPSLVPQTHIYNPGVVVHTCNLSAGEQETGGRL